MANFILFVLHHPKKKYKGVSSEFSPRNQKKLHGEAVNYIS